MKTLPVLVIALLTLAATSRGEEAPREEVTDLKTQLAGTTWRIPPGQPQRPGLAAKLTFNADQVAPEGYRYETKSNTSLTIFFNHGDSQLLHLDPDGQHLRFTLRQKSYSYVLAAEAHHDDSALRTQLDGSTWNAIPIAHTRPGLAPKLTFTKQTIAPAGYAYDVNASDSITVHFNHGDAQILVLSDEGKHLTAIFQNQKYEYERAEP